MFEDSNGLSHNADDLLQRQQDLINLPAREATREGADSIYTPTLKNLKKIFGLDKPKKDPTFPDKVEKCE